MASALPFSAPAQTFHDDADSGAHLSPGINPGSLYFQRFGHHIASCDLVLPGISQPAPDHALPGVNNFPCRLLWLEQFFLFFPRGVPAFPLFVERHGFCQQLIAHGF
jgi:hypothetical protein